MRTGIIHLINPRTDSLTTRPICFNRALYCPLAGLLAVAACIPRDQYEVVLTDENIETIDFDLKADLVGISAMTSYVNRGYEIADRGSCRFPTREDGVGPASCGTRSRLQHCRRSMSGAPRCSGRRVPRRRGFRLSLPTASCDLHSRRLLHIARLRLFPALASCSRGGSHPI